MPDLERLFLAVTLASALFGLWQAAAYIIELHRLTPAEDDR